MTYQVVACRLDMPGQHGTFSQIVPCTEQMGESPGPICIAGIAKMLAAERIAENEGPPFQHQHLVFRFLWEHL